MKITIVSGSHRKKSQSERISLILRDKLQAQKVDVELVNLAGNPLPFWDEEVWEDSPKWQKIWGPISDGLKASDGFVIVTPEWHGMVPSGLKNFFLLASGGELKHKPGYIVSVSAGAGGAYPVAELRMSSYKNSRICYIPEHLIVRQAENFLKDPTNPADSDKKTLARMDYGLKLLVEYAKQLQPIRALVTEEEKQFPTGM